MCSGSSALFYIALDWIMSKCANNSRQYYIYWPRLCRWCYSVQWLFQASGHSLTQLVIPWVCIRHGPRSVFKTLNTGLHHTLRVSNQGNPVNVTTRLIYLGRDVSSCSDDQAHWPRSKHHESADTCMTAVKTESEYHAVAIQCPCCLCIGPRPIVGLRRRNPDLDKVRRTEVGSLPDVMPAT